MIDITDQRNQHLLAHPYFILGIQHERQRIIDLLRNNEEWNNVQDAIDGLEVGA